MSKKKDRDSLACSHTRWHQARCHQAFPNSHGVLCAGLDPCDQEPDQDDQGLRVAAGEVESGCTQPLAGSSSSTSDLVDALLQDTEQGDLCQNIVGFAISILFMRYILLKPVVTLLFLSLLAHCPRLLLPSESLNWQLLQPKG